MFLIYTDNLKEVTVNGPLMIKPVFFSRPMTYFIYRIFYQ